ALPFFVEKLLYRSARQHEADIVVSCPVLALYFIAKIGDGDTCPWMSAIENQFVSIPETMGIEIAQLHDDGKRIGTRNM
ncbi:hypothetical protein, partial [Salmonella sp. SAL4455]|uniref:hypothetical protein n=1 Tax=Salmonella sp. SAL4455 TaxID=3159910 RepID=UPI00397E49DC